MKKEKIMDIIFTLIGIVGFLEFSFLQGLFTGTIMMIVCGITGLVALIYKLVKKEYHLAILYTLLFATISLGYLNLM